MDFAFISELLKSPFIQAAIIILIALTANNIVGLIIGRIVRRAVRSHHYATRIEEEKRAQTITDVFRAVSIVIIWVVAIAAVLSAFGVNFAAVAASLGFLGVVIGLGAQTTIRDYVAGVFILIENQYRVGDVVTLSGGTTGQLGTSGVVEEITLRITKLRDLDGTLNIVRNGEAAIITNRTYEYSSIVIDIGVGYDSDIDTVEKVMNRVGQDLLLNEEIAKSIKEPIQFLRVNEFLDSSVVVRALGTVEPAEQWGIAGEYRRRILAAFRKEGIEIPLPQIVIHESRKKSQKK